MEIENLVSFIRKSNIGNLMYKAKPAGNFLGVYGLKARPKDIDFLETGPLEDIDNSAIIKKNYTLFRSFIPKDFAVISTTKYWIKTNQDTAFPINEYHLVDIDIYTYLLVAEAFRTDVLPLASTNFNHLYYFDGRFVDYTSLITQNIHRYSLILGEKSNLTPYIYKKENINLFSETSSDDFLINSSSFTVDQIKEIFNEINIFSDIKKEV